MCLFFFFAAEVTGHMHAAGTGMRQGMCHTAAVADHIQSFVCGLQILIYRNLHVVELDLDPVQQRIIVCRSRCHLV